MYKRILVVCCIFLVVCSAFAQDSSSTMNLSLKNAMEIALKNHPEIIKFKMGVEAARGRYSQGIALPRPEIAVGYEFIPSGKGPGNYDERSIELSQAFEFPSLYFYRGSKSKAEINAAEFEYNQAERTVRLAVKKAYYAALAKYKLLGIAEENLNLAAEFHRKAEIRYKAGEASNLEFLTAKVQLSEAKTLIGTSNKEFLSALNGLKYAMGFGNVSEPGQIVFADTLGYTKHEISEARLIERCIKENPQINRSVALLEASRIDKSIADMGYLPSFDAAYMFQSKNSGGGYYGFRLGMSIPIWFMTEQKGRQQEAGANLQWSASELESVRNKVKSSLTDAWLNYGNDEKQVLLYQSELLPQADEVYRTANLSYQAGEISYLEYLQAKFTLINARINYTKSLLDYNEAVINLEETSGVELD